MPWANLAHVFVAARHCRLLGRAKPSTRSLFVQGPERPASVRGGHGLWLLSPCSGSLVASAAFAQEHHTLSRCPRATRRSGSPGEHAD